MRLDSTEGEVPVVVEAGTVLMVHYDLWHRGMGKLYRQEALHDEVHVGPHRRAAGPELGQSGQRVGCRGRQQPQRFVESHVALVYRWRQQRLPVRQWQWLDIGVD